MKLKENYLRHVSKIVNFLLISFIKIKNLDLYAYIFESQVALTVHNYTNA